MGAKESKQSCISYEEALKRVSESEFRRLKDAFKKSAGVGRLYLSRNAFQKDVLCEGVPSNITELLYSACGGTSKGISFKDLLCGLVLITRGTEEEKTKFLWSLYCNDSGTYIVKSDYIKTVNLQPCDSKSLFAHNDRVNYEQFQDWIQQHKRSTILSQWLLADSSVSLTSELETPTFYQSLAGVTHLEEKDIGDLEKEFWNLKNSSSNGQISLQYLGPLISPPIPKNALLGLFNAFDENRDGHIDFKELCCGVSAATRGPIVERTRFCFKIFDVDRDGVLNHDETLQMINVLLFVAKENRNATLYKDLNKGDVIGDLIAFSAKKAVPKDSDAILDSDTKDTKESKELKNTNTITHDNLMLTAEDFMMWSVESILKLVQPFLDLIFEVCHIVFGLWPQCRHMEHDIVRGWLLRDEKRQYRVGQFWYLISREWWVSWSLYTQNASTPCEYCKKISSQRSSNAGVGNGIDEALVCDESFNSNSLDSVGEAAIAVAADSYSLGSTSSGISAGRHCGMRPGPIDNTNLVMPNPFKNVRTLTGEGGHLKLDTPLVQTHDFELVPKSLWKALNRWYGCNLPLPRQVIQAPNTNQVELELFPLNLRIVLHQPTHTNQTVNNWGTVAGGYGVLAAGGGYAAISASNAVLQPPKRVLGYTAAFSHLATVRQIGEFLCDQLRLKTEDIRLWHIPSGPMENNAILLEEDNMMLKELLIKNNDQLLLEIRNKDQTWPEELGSLSLGQNSNISDRRMTRSSVMSVHPPGATGLHNLGNTCFMNAALQVLFNTQTLAQYFRNDMHLYELNTVNKLGTRGQLATRYGELLKEVWTATTRSVAPLKLRFCVTKHAPQFAGGGQHDSQELLEWFLDALHEDLNRVMETPYTELKDSNGRPDKIVAAEAWAHHHSRNQSIIIDLFYGQLKSKVSCLGCGQESVRFDPFSLLSLPLPVENYVYFEVVVILLDGAIPTKYGLRLNSESKNYDLKHKLSTLCGLHPSLMLVCEIWNSQIRQILLDEEKIKPATAKDLFVYQLPEECHDRSRSSSTLGVHIEKGLKDIQRSALTSGYDSLTSLSTLDLQKTSMNSNYPNNNITQAPEVSYSDEAPLQMKNYPLHNGIVTSSLDDDNDDDTDEQVSTKQSPNLSRSPENSFVNCANRKTICSTKLLNNDSATCSSSFTNNSGENSMENSTIEPIPPDPFATNTFCSGGLHFNECNCRSHNNNNNINITNINNNISVNFRNNNMINTNMNSFNDNSLQNDFDDDIILNRNSANLQRTTANEEDSPFGLRSSYTKDHHSQQPPSQHLFLQQHDHQQTQYQQNNSKIGKYLVAVHRKITRHDSYFLSYHKTRPSLFGVPLLVPNNESGTNKDLYCAIWMQVSRLLSPLPAATDQANHAADCDDSLGYNFPFTLRAVKCDGLTCAICPWSNFCRGCEIPCNNEYVLQSSLMNVNTSTPNMTPKFSSLPNLETKMKPDYKTTVSHNANPNNNAQAAAGVSSVNGANSSKYFDDFTIAIDWDPTALHLRYQSTLEKLSTEHETVAICRKEQIEPVDLNHCLRAFTSEEKLEQWYHCSHCKGKKPATKKLQIWKLPPILIVHLKRFNCVNRKWVKSQKVVHFPFDNFDPTPYLASVPQETILRHKELLEMADHCTDTHLEVTKEIDNEDIKFDDTPVSSPLSTNQIELQLESTPRCAGPLDSRLVEAFNEKPANLDSVITSLENDDCDSSTEMSANHNSSISSALTLEARKKQRAEKRKRLISTSLAKTPIIDGEFEDFHQHKLKPGQDAFDIKYKLYAVVSHSGMLNGGHYISYAANSNGTWYCYNDSSCREIPSQQPNIDPSSAYLLFYERVGLDYEPYLPNIEGKPIPNGSLNSLEIDDSDNDLKKMCAIS